MDDTMVSMNGHNDIFAAICGAHDIKIEALRVTTGAGLSTIDGWLHGTRVIPIAAWSILFSLTRDPRIPQMFGMNDVQVVRPEPQRKAPPGDPADLIPELISAQEEAAICMRYLHAIVRDSRIDAKDDTAIGQFVRHRRAVEGLYDRVESALVAMRAKA